jgi:hypothetical protein
MSFSRRHRREDLGEGCTAPIEARKSLEELLPLTQAGNLVLKVYCADDP